MIIFLYNVIYERGYIMKYTTSDHTFVVCAYKESKYLAECIESLKKQTVNSRIIIATSTPNEHIYKVANEYGIEELYIRTGESQIALDWNFALDSADTPLVTIAHQDDVYCETYLEDILHIINRKKRTLIAFTGYGEIREGEKVHKNKLLNIKKLMLFPLRPSFVQNSRFLRRRILSFGSPIACPAVTYVKTNLPKNVFEVGYRSDVDWQAWEKLSRLKGAFGYTSKIRMYHRIHTESATTEIIADNDRSAEDLDMFKKFWPGWIARIIEHFYKKGEDSNKLK